MDNQGWIKLHRKITITSFYKQPLTLALFVHLILKANHEDNKIIWNKKEIIIKRGSMVTGRNTLSKESGISQQSIRTGLATLKSTNTITINATTKFSVITILNYEQYQSSTSRLTNSQPTANQQPTTNNKDKNENNDKNNKNSVVIKTKYSSLDSLNDLVLEEIANKYKVPLAFVRSELDSMTNWLGSKGKKYLDYRLALMNWVKTDALKIIQKSQLTKSQYKPTEIKI